jgi:hypothetical protein
MFADIEHAVILLQQGENSKFTIVGEIRRRILSISNEMEEIHLVTFRRYFCPKYVKLKKGVITFCPHELQRIDTFPP